MQTFYRNLFTLLLRFFSRFEVEEQYAENEDTSHHAECTCVVRIGANDETLILRMFQWTDGHL